MNDTTQANQTETQNIARLAIMAMLEIAVDEINDGSRFLPRILALSGEAGLGKSIATAAAAAKFGGVYVRGRSSWTRKSMLQYILEEISGAIPPAKSVDGLLRQVCDQLAATGALLIIDEFDYAIEAKLVDLVRDIHDVSGCAVLLVGEVSMPATLAKWARFHSRVRKWLAAPRASEADVAALTGIYAPNLRIEADLIRHFITASRGNVRRICGALSQVHQDARGERPSLLGLSWWGDRACPALQIAGSSARDRKNGKDA
jgi:DNA transposition AAA+ family ATPase